MLLLDLLLWCRLLQGGFLGAGISHLKNDRHFMVSTFLLIHLIDIVSGIINGSLKNKPVNNQFSNTIEIRSR